MYYSPLLFPLYLNAKTKEANPMTIKKVKEKFFADWQGVREFMDNSSGCAHVVTALENSRGYRVEVFACVRA